MISVKNDKIEVDEDTMKVSKKKFYPLNNFNSFMNGQLLNLSFFNLPRVKESFNYLSKNDKVFTLIELEQHKARNTDLYEQLIDDVSFTNFIKDTLKLDVNEYKQTSHISVIDQLKVFLM